MDKDLAKRFYSREDIQKAILRFAKNREIGVRYDGYFGKRPDTIEFLSDVKKLVKQGVFSFHASEERWANPLLLGNDKIDDNEKAKNRIGWDLILDLDGVDFEYAKIIGKLIIDYLKELGIKNISTKFSGNKGFHIGIPFEAFSANIIGIGETRNLFPDVAKRIATLLMYELEDKIINEILKKDKSIKNIANKYQMHISDLTDINGKLNYMKLIEIDTILISSRHLFRMPYSFNEKSQLISIPVKNEKIMEFKKEEAQPNTVNLQKYEKYDFLKYNPQFGKDADILLIKSYEEDNEEDYEKIRKAVEKKKRGEKRGLIFTGDYEVVTYEIEGEVKLKDFPETINYILNNKFKDGRKRALFVLLTYLYSIKWNSKVIEEIIYEWDNKQEKPLKEKYISAQLSWFNSQENTISPPNFENDNYYKSIGIPLDVINKDKNKFKGRMKIKNPFHYIYILLKYTKKTEEEKKTKKKKTKPKKESQQDDKNKEVNKNV